MRRRRLWLVVGASSPGTVFEWYDFLLYGLPAGALQFRHSRSRRSKCDVMGGKRTGVYLTWRAFWPTAGT
jgi:hypothetical protein